MRWFFSSLWLASALSASAGIAILDDLIVDVSLSETVFFFQSGNAGPIDSGLLDLEDPGFGPGLQTGRGVADYGLLRGSLSGREIESFPEFGSFGVGFRDELTVTPPPGVTAEGILFTFTLDGILSVTPGDGAGDASFNLSAEQGDFFDEVSEFWEVDESTPTIALNETIEISAPLAPGLPVILAAFLDASLDGVGNFDLLNTAQLTGILVVDDQLQPVPGALVTGASGTSYTGSVIPEPSILANLLLGVLLLRRRR